MSYQFIHLESYSRKGKKSGGKNWSSREIAAEADRDSNASLHVKEPKSPTVIFNPHNFKNVGELAKKCEEMAEQNVNEKGKAIRKDTAVMGAGICSHPYTMQEVKNSKEKQKELNDWLTDTKKFLQEEHGDQLEMIIFHKDEKHPHVHYYISPKNPINGVYSSEGLHCGKDAQNEAKASKKPVSERRKAYCEAMRGYQDRYNEKVGLKNGLLRIGPGRQRLSRSEYQNQKAQAQIIKDSFQKIEEKEKKINEVYSEKKADLTAEKNKILKAKKQQEKTSEKLKKAKAILQKKEAALVREREELEKPTAKLGALVAGFGKGKEKIKEEVRKEEVAKFSKEKSGLTAEIERQKNFKKESHGKLKNLRSELADKNEKIAELGEKVDRQRHDLQDMIKQLENHGIKPSGQSMEDAILRLQPKP